MHSRLRPSPAMIVALIALFVALGGTAAGLAGSDTVQSDDLGPGAQVKAPDVAANAVNSADVVNDGLSGADVLETSLAQVPFARTAILGGKGRSSPGGGTCDPESVTFINCGNSVAINVPANTMILLHGQGTAFQDDESGGRGTGACRIGSASHGPAPQSAVTMDTRNGDFNQITSTLVWGPFPAGSYSFGFDCNEASNVNFFNTRITAVALSGS
jgi:hypothetical protein